MSSSPKLSTSIDVILVLLIVYEQVTEGMGFIGFHILTHLLDNGYFVRAVSRSGKVELLKVLSVNHNSDKFEVVEISDISSGDYRVRAIIHAVAPLSGRTDPETAFMVDYSAPSTVEGSLHVLGEAVKAKVPRIVTTNSVSRFPFPQGPFGVDDWNPITKAAAIASGAPFPIYQAAKKEADIAVLEFAESYLEIDVTLLGPHNHGRFAPGFERLIAQPSVELLSTDKYIYALLNPDNTSFPKAPSAVRDVARAHVLALQSRATTEVGRKRFAVVSPYESSFQEAIAIIRRERTELKDCLADAARASVYPSDTLPVNWDEIEDFLGLTQVIGYSFL
ncbi:NAD(P)-binding protein [Armillaria gallica]|uniref:NAD(P)-binding protein n=1 Tax=Armillaria gallica TaxID=47427 RepID=A0A2H3DFH7_ARMGA|nr:NAD(P)-binding protein [Armillaria gallica]